MCARQLKRRVWAGRGGRRKQAIDKTENFICSLNVLWVLMSFAASLQRSCYSILLPLLLPALLPPPLLPPPCSCLASSLLFCPAWPTKSFDLASLALPQSISIYQFLQSTDFINFMVHFRSAHTQPHTQSICICVVAQPGGMERKGHAKRKFDCQPHLANVV